MPAMLGKAVKSALSLSPMVVAVIIGFRVRPQTAARLAAENNDIDVRVYDVIYEAVDEVTARLGDLRLSFAIIFVLFYLQFFVRRSRKQSALTRPQPARGA